MVLAACIVYLLTMPPGTNLSPKRVPKHLNKSTMSGPPQSQSSIPTTKATTSDSTQTPQVAPQKTSAQLEEDDEFEDFPVEGEYFLRKDALQLHLIASLSQTGGTRRRILQAARQASIYGRRAGMMTILARTLRRC